MGHVAEHVALELNCFFFQAEDGIRDYKVTGVQTCALPISLAILVKLTRQWLGSGETPGGFERDRKSGVEGKSVDLGGRRIIKKKKRKSGSRRTRSDESPQ